MVLDHESNDDPAATVYAAMIGLWDKESDRYWTRNNILLALNAGMLAIIASGQSGHVIRGVACVLGAFLSFIWILLNRKGRYYTYRWRPVIEQYERELQSRDAFRNLPLLFTGTSRHPDSASKARQPRELWNLVRGERLSFRDAAGLMNLIVAGFLLAWISLLILTVVGF